jgi:hypothetical protein
MAALTRTSVKQAAALHPDAAGVQVEVTLGTTHSVVAESR